MKNEEIFKTHVALFCWCKNYDMQLQKILIKKKNFTSMKEQVSNILESFSKTEITNWKFNFGIINLKINLN